MNEWEFFFPTQWNEQTDKQNFMKVLSFCESCISQWFDAIDNGYAFEPNRNEKRKKQKRNFLLSCLFELLFNAGIRKFFCLKMFEKEMMNCLAVIPIHPSVSISEGK